MLLFLFIKRLMDDYMLRVCSQYFSNILGYLICIYYGYKMCMVNALIKDSQKQFSFCSFSHQNTCL